MQIVEVLPFFTLFFFVSHSSWLCNPKKEKREPPSQQYRARRDMASNRNSTCKNRMILFVSLFCALCKKGEAIVAYCTFVEIYQLVFFQSTELRLLQR